MENKWKKESICYVDDFYRASDRCGVVRRDPFDAISHCSILILYYPNFFRVLPSGDRFSLRSKASTRISRKCCAMYVEKMEENRAFGSP